MRKNVATILTLFLTAATLTGCSVGNTTVSVTAGLSRHTIFRIDNLRCPEKEAVVYLSNDKNIYGVVLGNSLWTSDYDTARMETSIKAAVLEHLTKVYALNAYAAEHDMTLTEDELQKTYDAADEYFRSLNTTEKQMLNVTENDIRKMYARYALAEKIYYELMGTVDEEVSEDEARVMDAEIFTVSTKRAMKAAKNELKDGTDFETVANTYNESDENVTVSFTRNTYPPEVEEIAFRLENGETAYAIRGSDKNYYFIKCLDKYNEALSEANKKNVIESRQTKVIEDIVNGIRENSRTAFNEKRWNEISVPSDEAVTTDSFFVILDSYLTYN